MIPTNKRSVRVYVVNDDGAPPTGPVSPLPLPSTPIDGALSPAGNLSGTGDSIVGKESSPLIPGATSSHVHKAVIERKIVVEAGSHRRSVAGADGQRKSVAGPGGQRKSVSGQRKSVSGAGGPRKSVSGTGGQRKSVSGAGGQRKSVAGPGGKRNSVVGANGAAAGGRRRSSIMVAIDKIKGAVDDWEGAFLTENDSTKLLFFFTINYSEKFVQFVNYLAFAVILVAYLYVDYTPDAYWQSYAIDSTFIGGSISPRTTYMDIHTAPQWYDWATFVLIPRLYPTQYHNGAPIPPERLRYIAGDGGLRLGQARLRQLRVRPNACTISTRFNDSLGMCNALFDDTSMDTDPWPELGLTFQGALELDQTDYVGASTLSVYPGSGYATLLPDDPDDAARVVETLYNGTWIDERTRAVFAEFSTFNPANRLFSMVTIAAEVTAAGEMVPSRYVRTLALLQGWSLLQHQATTTDVVSFFLIIALYFAVLIKTLTLVARVGRRPELRKQGWVWLEALNVALFWVQFGLGMSVTLWLLTQGDNEFKKMEGFCRLFRVTTVYEYERSVCAFNATLTLMLVFQFMGFSKGLNQFNETFTRSWRDLATVMAVITIIVVGYALSFMLTFGKAMAEFRNFSESVATLFIAVLTASMDVPRLRAVQPVLGPLLYVTFIVLMVMVVLSMIFAVINQAFDAYREEGAADPNDPMVRDMLRAGQFWIKLAYKTPGLRRLLPGTERTAVNRFFMFTRGRLVLTKEELNAQLDVDHVLEMAGAGGAGGAARTPGHGWDQDGFCVPLPERPRVALLSDLRDLDDAQRRLVKRLEAAVIAARQSGAAGLHVPDAR